MDKPIRILVVDDFAPFRELVVSLFHAQSNLQIIGEASDGLEGVQKTRELNPDLVLLDIGLPRLNGIEAGRQILTFSPNCRIIFISQEMSIDFVSAALSIGASGYISKMDVENELVAAVNAALQGEHFVGRRFIGQDFMNIPALRDEEIVHRHEVGFYSDDQLFLRDVGHFVGVALRTGKAVIVVATESHRNSLRETLLQDGLDITEAIGEGRYTSLDAVNAISTFMLNGQFDSERYVRLFISAIITARKAARNSSSRVVVFGECVSLLCKQGYIDVAIEIETLCNQMVKTYPVDFLCGYSVDHFPSWIEPNVSQKICNQHSAVISG